MKSADQTVSELVTTLAAGADPTLVTALQRYFPDRMRQELRASSV